jgi:hypothetical protein
MRKPRTEWKPEHTALMVKLHAAGCSDHVIAGATGHDVDTVQRRRSAMGLSANYRSQIGTWESLPLLSCRAICGKVVA